MALEQCAPRVVVMMVTGRRMRAAVERIALGGGRAEGGRKGGGCAPGPRRRQGLALPRMEIAAPAVGRRTTARTVGLARQFEANDVLCLVEGAVAVGSATDDVQPLGLPLRDAANGDSLTRGANVRMAGEEGARKEAQGTQG